MRSSILQEGLPAQSQSNTAMEAQYRGESPFFDYMHALLVVAQKEREKHSVHVLAGSMPLSQLYLRFPPNEHNKTFIHVLTTMLWSHQSPVIRLYFDEGHSIVVETSVKFYCVLWLEWKKQS